MLRPGSILLRTLLLKLLPLATLPVLSSQQQAKVLVHHSSLWGTSEFMGLPGRGMGERVCTEVWMGSRVSKKALEHPYWEVCTQHGRGLPQARVVS